MGRSADGRARLRAVRRRLPDRRHAAEAGSRLRVLRLGGIARRALRRSAGTARPLAGFAASPWYDAAGEILWIGSKLPALHPRAVLTALPPERGEALRFDSIPRSSWSPRLPLAPRQGVQDALRRLRRALVAKRTPGGFGVLLAGKAPEFPLDLVMPHVGALVRALARSDALAAQLAATRLVGVGAGLTPSGDDLLGGVLFARRWLQPRDERWVRLGKLLSVEMKTRSHAVSGALFADLACGKSFAPLHELCAALAAKQQDRALVAAGALVAIGHSSGWDMLTGFFAGAGAMPARRFSRR